jgi:hypothetical protein
MAPSSLIVVPRNEILEFGDENHRSRVATAGGWPRYLEQPFARYSKVSEPPLANDPANYLGLTTSYGKALPIARFLLLAALFLDEKHLEDVSAKCVMGRYPHEASRIAAPDLKARFEKGGLIVDRSGETAPEGARGPSDRKATYTSSFSHP